MANELELLAVIEKAPHGNDCEGFSPLWGPKFGREPECTCWKSKVDTSALAEYRRHIIEEIIAGLQTTHIVTLAGKGGAYEWLRALAEKGRL